MTPHYKPTYYCELSAANEQIQRLETEVAELRKERKAVVAALNEAAAEGHFDSYDEATELLRSLESHWLRLQSVFAKEQKRLDFLIGALNEYGTSGLDTVLRWGYPGLDRGDIDEAMGNYPEL